ncbi:MAG: metal ABC transporter permease [Rickettsiaceae bacterium]|nr:metal ABC transporter permease [Rickettsiaceae bacterium]
MITYITSEIFLITTAIILLNILLAPLGCIVLWQRQTYFCEGIAHGCFLALAITAISGLPVIITVLGVSIILALLLSYAQSANKDAITSTHVIAHGMVALSVILFNLVSTRYDINVSSIFFGDILAINTQNLISIAIVTIFVLFFIFRYINQFILVSLNHELSFARKIVPWKLELLLLLMLAITIAVTVKIIGTLLVSALATIVPATARMFSNTPQQMMLISLIMGITISCICLFVSFILDVPTTALITTVEAVIFLIATYLGKRHNS